LEDRGYELDFVTSESKGINFRKYGEWQYDNLILFAPSIQEVEGLTEEDLIDFIDAGKNIIVAADSNIGDLIGSVASECNVLYDESETFAVDHFNFDVSDYDGKHNLIVAENLIDSTPILGGKIKAPVLFRGVAQDIEEDSAVLFPILSGYSTTYSAPADGSISQENLHVAGKKTVLVSALQARNNARVIFAGSLEMFSDKFFNSPVQKSSATGNAQKYEKSGNEDFCKQIARWVFQERGILRVKNVHHHKVGETEAPNMYTIKDDIEYSIEIEELQGKKWIPFTTNDVQLEFIRLDPHVRTTLASDGNGRFSSTFKIPDVYGVFTFKVEYNRKGFGYLNSIVRVDVRPFRHNQYERFLVAAYPYYASAFSMMAGLFIFSWFFLYHKQK